MSPVRVDAIASGELVAGQLVSVELERRVVLLVRTASGVFAIDDRCPHAQQSLATGKIKDGRVTCRHHGVEVDLATGRVTWAMGFRGLEPVEVFTAFEQDGRVFVEIP